MEKNRIDAFVHHIAEAQRVLASAAEQLCKEVDERYPLQRNGKFSLTEAREWNTIANTSTELLDARDSIVELTPADAPLV